MDGRELARLRNKGSLIGFIEENNQFIIILFDSMFIPYLLAKQRPPPNCGKKHWRICSYVGRWFDNKCAPIQPLCGLSPQILHNLSWDWLYCIRLDRFEGGTHTAGPPHVDLLLRDGSILWDLKVARRTPGHFLFLLGDLTRFYLTCKDW